jgi:hypothetical protein
VAEETLSFDSEGVEAPPAPRKAVERAEESPTRTRAAVSLAIAGASYVEIADTLNYVTPMAAQRAVEAALAKAYSPETDYAAQRRLMVARYEALLKSLAPKALNAKITIPDPKDPEGKRTIKVANEDHLATAKEFRSTVQAISVLMGLNAPQVHEIRSPEAEEFSRVVTDLVAIQTNGKKLEGDIFDDDEVVYEEDGSLSE